MDFTNKKTLTKIGIIVALAILLIGALVGPYLST